MTEILPARGTKRTCLSCEARFYDLGRFPALCPKCGAECAEIVRPPPTPRSARKRWPFGKDRTDYVPEGESGATRPAHAERSEDEEGEPEEEAERERDDEGGEEAEGEPTEE